MSERSDLTLPLWTKLLLGLLTVVVAAQGFLVYKLTLDHGDPPSAAEGEPLTRAFGDLRPRTPNLEPESQPWQTDPIDAQNWDPFEEMQQMRERMDRMFGEAFGRFEQSSRFDDLLDTDSPLSPRIDLRETDEAFEVTVDIPGAERSRIKTTLEDQTLRIEAETEAGVERREGNDKSITLRRERQVGRFERSIALPKPVESAGMTTSYDNGVLKIRIPKSKDYNPSDEQ